MKILIVDDEAAVADVTQAMVNALGHSSKVVNDVEGAREQVNRENWDLLILDLMLGDGQTGKSLLMEVRKTHPDQMALLMTATPTFLLEQLKLAEIFDDIVRKPFTFTDFKAKIINIETRLKMGHKRGKPDHE